MTAPRFYKARIVKLGPFVGVKVWHGPPWIDGEELDRAPRLQALLDTETTARAVLQTGDDDVPVEIDGVTIRNIEPVTAAEYRFLVADSAHAQAYRPDDPKANPRERVDFDKLTPF